MADLVIDTDVVSFGFRQDSRYQSTYGPAIAGHRGVISFMTVAELRYGTLWDGWGPTRTEELRLYLNRHFIRYSITEALCDAWAELICEARRQGRVLNVGDAWIAATAVVLGVPLVTHNAKDFQFLPQLKLITFPDT